MILVSFFTFDGLKYRFKLLFLLSLPAEWINFVFIIVLKNTFQSILFDLCPYKVFYVEIITFEVFNLVAKNIHEVASLSQVDNAFLGFKGVWIEIVHQKESPKEELLRTLGYFRIRVLTVEEKLNLVF